MHRKIVCIVLSAALALGFASCKKDAWIPSWFESPRAVAWQEIRAKAGDTRLATLTKKEALDDLDAFRYLIETSYAGYEYQKKFNHVDFGKNFRRAAARIRHYKDDAIPSGEFAKIIANTLKGERDGHFCVDGKYLPYQHEAFYRTEITVSKRDGKLVVDSSSVPGVTVGDQYRDSRKRLFRVWSAEGERYRVGTLSTGELSNLSLKIGKGRIRVPVSSISETPPAAIGNVRWSFEGDIAYLRIPSFCAADDTDIVSVTGKKRLEEIADRIRELPNAKIAIIDLRDNLGGYNGTAAAIPAAVFNRPWYNFAPATAALSSPGVAQAQVGGFWDLGNGDDTSRLNRKAWQIEADNQKARPRRFWTRAITRTDSIKPVETEKRLIIVINRRSASASELICACRYIPGVTIVGENSAGAMYFTDTLPYYLPHSGIGIMIPSSFNFDLSYSAGEGTGVLPDYWASDGELETTIRGITGEAGFSIPGSEASKLPTP